MKPKSGIIALAYLGLFLNFSMQCNAHNVAQIIPPSRWSGIPAFSPDGKRIAAAFPAMVPVTVKSDDGTPVPAYNFAPEHPETVILRSDTFEKLPVSIPDELHSPQWSPDGKMIAGSTYSSGTAVYSATTGRTLHHFAPKRNIVDIAWSPTGTCLAITEAPKIEVIDVGTWKVTSTFTDQVIEFRWPSWSPDGHFLAASAVRPFSNWSDQNGLRIWDTKTNKLIWQLDHPDGVGQMSWAPSGLLIAYSDSDLFVHILTFPQMKEITRIAGDRHSSAAFEWAPDGKHILVTDGFTISICDANTGQHIANAKLDEYSVAIWAPDGRAILLGNREGGAKLLAVNLNAASPASMIEGGQAGDPWASESFPRTLEECFPALEKAMSPKDLQTFKKNSEDGLLQYTAGPSMGMHLRNMWGLRGHTPLAKYFNAIGVTDGRQMSDIIIEQFWRHLNGKDISLPAPIALRKALLDAQRQK